MVTATRNSFPFVHLPDNQRIMGWGGGPTRKSTSAEAKSSRAICVLV